MSRICSERRSHAGGAPRTVAPRRSIVGRLTLGLFALLAVATAAPVAVAQAPDGPDRACEAELAAEHRRVSGTPTGLAAARLLRTAVEAVEPALPPVRGATVPHPARGHADAAWLAERRLLPADWSPSAVEPEAWKAVLDDWRARYRLEPMATEGATAPRALTLDLTRVLHDLRDAVRPLALIAFEGEEVVFNGMIWNFTPHPRFLLARPPALYDGDAPGAADREARFARALALLSSCARHVSDFVTLPSDLALDLFLSAPESTMLLIASEPNRDDRWPARVTRDEAAPGFRYASPLVEGVDVVAVEFVGPSMTLGGVLAFLGRMGGNVGVGELLYFLQFP